MGIQYISESMIVQDSDEKEVEEVPHLITKDSSDSVHANNSMSSFNPTSLTIGLIRL